MASYKNSFLFSFEELPLLIDKGFEAGLVNGQAEISYTGSVIDFTVTGLWLDGHKAAEYTEEAKLTARLTDKILPRFIENPVPVEAGSWLDTTICGRLYAEWCHHVHEAIRDQLNEARDSVVQNLADYRRDRQYDDELLLIDYHLNAAE